MTARTELAENFGKSRGEKPTLASPAPVAPEPPAQKPAAPKPATQQPPTPMPAAQVAPMREPAIGPGRREADPDEHDGSRSSPRRWGQDVGLVLKSVESSLPGSVPVAFGAGALALIGVLDWPVALGGTGLYTAYHWLRFGSPIGR